MKKKSPTNENNNMPAELTDKQAAQVTGGVSMIIDQRTLSSQHTPTRMSTASNILKQESDEDNNATRKIMNSLSKRPIPRG